MTDTGIQFVRVVGTRSTRLTPVVLCRVDGWMVTWRPNAGWRCECPIPEPDCDHVDEVECLLDPTILTTTNKGER